ncbi:MAG: molybdopterin molybdotransferase MoeA [Ilumatobacteraceae bacterium]
MATPVELPVVAELAAGASADRALGAGEAIRIMTGAPLPDGADAVVMVEDTERLDAGARVRITAAVEPGSARREAGSDIEAGTEVFRPGTLLTPAVLGVLASVNQRVIEVHPRPVVAVVSTGDELVEDNRPLRPGEIRESNRTMLCAAIEEAGCSVLDLGTVRDDEEALEAVLLDAARRVDAIVTSGGVSMGDYDVVKAVLDRIADMSWMQIAIKPAKPFAFGRLIAPGGHVVPVFGLPGNPVSSLVSFELLARPALRQMAGDPRIMRPTVRAVATEELRRRPDGKLHFARVHAQFDESGRIVVRSSGEQGSHQLASTAKANALAILPDGDGVGAGGEVDVMILRLEPVVRPHG